MLRPFRSRCAPRRPHASPMRSHMLRPYTASLCVHAQLHPAPLAQPHAVPLRSPTLRPCAAACCTPAPPHLNPRHTRSASPDDWWPRPRDWWPRQRRLDTNKTTSWSQPPVVRDEGGNRWTRQQSGYISGSVFYRPLPKNKIHLSRFPCLPPDTIVGETLSLSTVKLFPVIEFLQLCVPVLDTISYAQVQGGVSLLTVKLPCTIQHT